MSIGQVYVDTQLAEARQGRAESASLKLRVVVAARAQYHVPFDVRAQKDYLK